jgi:hypothetical protein
MKNTEFGGEIYFFAYADNFLRKQDFRDLYATHGSIVDEVLQKFCIHEDE